MTKQAETPVDEIELYKQLCRRQRDHNQRLELELAALTVAYERECKEKAALAEALTAVTTEAAGAGAKPRGKANG
ncbi:hypothetical protein [Aliihoeflea sp. PC F10.4]